MCPTRVHAIVSLIVTYYERNLPHWHPPGQDIFLTWRLKGSLPNHLRGIAAKDVSGRRFVELDRALDRGDVGPLWLRDERVVACLLSAFQMAIHRERMALHAYAIMANHVHVLITPTVSVAEITQHIKGASARAANRLLGFTGSIFWQDESFDHWVRKSRGMAQSPHVHRKQSGRCRPGRQAGGLAVVKCVEANQVAHTSVCGFQMILAAFMGLLIVCGFSADGRWLTLAA